MFHDRATTTDHIRLLEGIGAHQMTRHVTGNHNQRNRIHIGSSNAGNGICCPRA